MPAGFPDWPGCQRCRFPGLNVAPGFPDSPGLNLVSFAICFPVLGPVATTFLGYRGGEHPRLARFAFGFKRNIARAHRPIASLGTCLIRASFGGTDLENADSARRCRFRNSQQKRASDLDSTNVWIPKLDVAGSSPVSA
jgi:hypothetical protein